jgi:hypothetical protein
VPVSQRRQRVVLGEIALGLVLRDGLERDCCLIGKQTQRLKRLGGRE